MPLLDYTVTDGIARLALDRPDKLNSINAELLDELEQALDRAERDDSVRAILLAGRGRAFSAGFDLAASPERAGETKAERIRRELTRDFDVIMRFWDCPKPAVAAVHGYCLGSAMEIAALCDITIAAEDCRFGAPEVTYGSGIVCLVLPWIIGFKNANDVLLTGRKGIDAGEACRIGLANRVVPLDELEAAAMDIARTIAANDALAVRLTRRAIRRTYETAGFRRALQAALEDDIEIETTDTPESLGFNAILEQDGLKAALAWRAGTPRTRNH